jgi:AraC-like DNA-binding protein
MIWEGQSGGKLCVTQGAEMVFRSFFLRLEHLMPLFASHEISLLQQVTGHFRQSILFPSSTAVAMKCRRLVEEIPPQFDLEHRSHLLRVAAAILNEEFSTAYHQRPGSGQVEQRIVQIFEQLSVDQLLGLSVGELAAKFGCSRRHLNRLFHQYFSFSVGALRMELRLLKAVSLLRDVDAKVINVAAQCGFNHLGLFNTCFKKRFGVSPGRWRKQAMSGKINPAACPEANAPCPLQGKGLCPMSAGSSGGGIPVVPKISVVSKTSPPGKAAGARALPGTRAAQPPVQHYVLLAYPRPGNSIPLMA